MTTHNYAGVIEWKDGRTEEFSFDELSDYRVSDRYVRVVYGDGGSSLFPINESVRSVVTWKKEII